MLPIGDKIDNTPGASGELTAAEYNNHKNELQTSVTQTGQTLSGVVDDQLGKAMYIYSTGAQTMLDGAPSADIIQLTPLTGSGGLQVFDDYSQADGIILEFEKLVANTSQTVNVNVGQTAGTLLGAKSLKLPDGSNPLIGQVVGTLRIQFSVSNDYWIILPYGRLISQRGYIETELNVSGTNLIIENPQMEINRFLLNQSDVTIDLTALVASTWYALCLNESTGAITAEDIATVFNTGGGGNWDISGNQLDMYDSIWDDSKKYCVANDGTDDYRVFGIFRTNATPDGIDTIQGFQMIFYIPGIPLTAFYVYRNANQSTAGFTRVEHDTVSFDLNSEYNTSTYKYVPKITQKTALSGRVQSATTNLSANYFRRLEIRDSTSSNIAPSNHPVATLSTDLLLYAERTIPVSSAENYDVIIDIESRILAGSAGNSFSGFGQRG